MKFDDLWVQVGKQNILTDAELYYVPQDLSAYTKRRLCRKDALTAARIVADVIHEIEHGSIERLDVLIRRRI